jgi:adenine/guanine/hypoxanthine permease
MILMGLFKLGMAFVGGAIQRAVPKAGLLGSLAGVGIALMGCLQLGEILAEPVVGMLSLGLIFWALVARLGLPFRVPGVLASVAAGAAVYYGLGAFGLLSKPLAAPLLEFPVGFPLPTLAFLKGMPLALTQYLPMAVPFAILTVVGGINVTESARLAGDNYKTRSILLTEAVATLLAGLCGGVSQTTPYIGHPAYKAMGARAGYTLATGVVIGAGAALGALSILVSVLPEAAIAPILVFIGLEITAQGFLASPPRHGAAVALAFVPVAAAVVLIETGSLLSALGASPAALTGEAALAQQTLRVLGNGFILTALLWGWILVAIIERRLAVAGALCAFASLVTLFGVIHSPLADGALFWPWAAPAALPQRLAGAYGALAAICWLGAWGAVRAPQRISA